MLYCLPIPLASSFLPILTAFLFLPRLEIQFLKEIGNQKLRCRDLNFLEYFPECTLTYPWLSIAFSQCVCESVCLLLNVRSARHSFMSSMCHSRCHPSPPGKTAPRRSSNSSLATHFANPLTPPLARSFVNVQFSTWCYLCLLPFFKKDQNLYWLKSPSRAFYPPPRRLGCFEEKESPPHLITHSYRCNKL